MSHTLLPRRKTTCRRRNCLTRPEINDNTSTDFSIEESRPRHHILIICTDLADKFKSKHIVHAAIALTGYGHIVTIITCTHIHGAYEDDLSQIRIIEVGRWIPRNICGYFSPSFYFFRSLYAATWTIFSLKQLKPKPSVIFCEANFTAVPILKSFTDYKVIYFQYKFEIAKSHLPASDINLNKSWFVKQSLLNADDIIVPNKVFCGIFQRSWSAAKISPIIIQPFIDVRQLKKEKLVSVKKITEKLSRDCYVYLALGEYHQRSNFELAIEAFYILLHSVSHEMHKRMHLVISGHCSKRNKDHHFYYRKLSKKVRELSLLEHITFSKRFQRAHKKSLMMHSVAILDPITDEIFNRYVLEAMALGRPIIATDTGFTKEILENGITGFTVPATAEHFSVAMTELLLNCGKGEFVGKMAHCEFLKTYSMEAFGTKLNNLINKHCSKTRI